MMLFTAVPKPFRSIVQDAVFLQKVIGHSWDQLLLFDSDGAPIHITPTANPSLSDFDAGDGRFLSYLEPEQREDFRTILRQAWGSDDVFLLEYVLRKDLQSPEVWIRSKFLFYQGDSVRESCVMVMSKEITRDKEQEAYLRSLANLDPLTQLPNRRGLKEHYLKMQAFSKRYGMRFGVLYLDVDGFKGINDRYGHAGGDRFLLHIARTVKTCLRDSDLLARIGGDEFVILLHHVPDHGVLRTVINRIYERLAAGLELGGEPVPVSVSIGVSLYPDHGESLETLLHQADSALYKIKNEAKNDYALYSGPDGCCHASGL